MKVEAKVIAGWFAGGHPYFRESLDDLYAAGWRIAFMTQSESKITLALEREVDG